jgi:hypothetical protein
MKRRIKKDLQQKGKWDYTNDCPLRETELKEATWRPLFVGELMIKEKYEILSQTDKNNPLLGIGSIVDGHFKFTLSAYDELGIQRAGEFNHPTPRCVFTYMIRLRDAIDKAQNGNLENSVQKMRK